MLKQALGLTAALPLFNLNVISASFDNPADPNNQMAMLKQAQGSGIAVELVELGNEVYWNYSSYTAPFPTPQAYATQASQWAAEIRGTFPDAQVAAVAATIPPHRQALAQAQPCSQTPPPFPSTEKEKEQVARFSTWNAGLGGLDVTNINALTMHPYPHLDTYICQSQIAKPTPDTLPFVFAIPFEAAADFESDIANLPSSLPALPIWITEYGIWIPTSLPSGEQNVLGDTWAVALANTAFSMLLMQNSRVDMLVNIHLANNTDEGCTPCAIDLRPGPPSPTLHTGTATLSTTGAIWNMFSNAAVAAQSISSLTVPAATFPVNTQSYPCVVGILFTGAHRSILVANLCAEAQVQLASILGTSVPKSFSYFSGPPLDTAAMATQSTGEIIDGVATLPAYSISLIQSTGTLGRHPKPAIGRHPKPAKGRHLKTGHRE